MCSFLFYFELFQRERVIHKINELKNSNIISVNKVSVLLTPKKVRNYAKTPLKLLLTVQFQLSYRDRDGSVQKLFVFNFQLLSSQSTLNGEKVLLSRQFTRGRSPQLSKFQPSCRRAAFPLPPAHLSAKIKSSNLHNCVPTLLGLITM